ncbi:hypothetical protein MVEN_01727700 [Mycena venus]|uniref:Uncharacterized protein n=1 Tax=Mycena venus TaxID=2733690 RepID=A0A8H6XM19_9AGAR|nr:hypothetical protein MVEN_01727700 [Mycena venus]
MLYPARHPCPPDPLVPALFPSPQTRAENTHQLSVDLCTVQRSPALTAVLPRRFLLSTTQYVVLILSQSTLPISNNPHHYAQPLSSSEVIISLLGHLFH